jgi:hypothetical protein
MTYEYYCRQNLNYFFLIISKHLTIILGQKRKLLNKTLRIALC